MSAPVASCYFNPVLCYCGRSQLCNCNVPGSAQRRKWGQNGVSLFLIACVLLIEPSPSSVKRNFGISLASPTHLPWKPWHPSTKKGVCHILPQIRHVTCSVTISVTIIMSHYPSHHCVALSSTLLYAIFCRTG